MPHRAEVNVLYGNHGNVQVWCRLYSALISSFSFVECIHFNMLSVYIPIFCMYTFQYGVCIHLKILSVYISICCLCNKYTIYLYILHITYYIFYYPF